MTGYCLPFAARMMIVLTFMINNPQRVRVLNTFVVVPVESLPAIRRPRVYHDTIATHDGKIILRLFDVQHRATGQQDVEVVARPHDDCFNVHD
jgi:hypothetical protein